MNAMLARDELIERVNHMSDEQVASLLEFIRVMQGKESSYGTPTSDVTANDYDESKDPMVQGLFSGPSDLASRTKSILQEEFGRRKHDMDDKP